jgi:hypothetical protein
VAPPEEPLPPVEFEVPPPLEVPPAELPPPEAPVSLLAPLPEASSEPPLASLPPLAPVVPVPEELVLVVETELVWAASFSAVVSLGGVMLGVLRGTASETLLLPHAPSVRPQSSRTVTPTAARAGVGLALSGRPEPFAVRD